MRESDPAEALVREQLDRDGDDGLVGRPSPGGALAALAAADVGLVHFDHAVEPVPIGTHHGAAQLVHPRPRRAVRAHPQDPLQAQRGDAVLLRGDEPHRREPVGQWQGERWKIVPAVTDVLCRHDRHNHNPAAVSHASGQPQRGQRNPSGQHSRAKYEAPAWSSGNQLVSCANVAG
jgi:hypothetical protein